MKKLLTIFIITLTSSQLFAQERAKKVPLLKRVDKSLSSFLSPEHQVHVENLKGLDSYLDVSVIAINSLDNIQNGASFKIDLPNEANMTISNVNILEQPSEYKAILQG